MIGKQVGYWLPTIVWMAIIFFLSSRPTIATSQIYWQDFILKKSAHLCIYFILGLFTYRSLKHTTNFSRPKLIFWTIIISGLYAVSDEVHQSFVPGRGPAVRDVVIDVVGSALGVTLLTKVYNRSQ